MDNAKEAYDFSGWATRNDVRCSDGRTIKKDAFKHNDGMVVPLVWNHNHNDPHDVLGHALLKNRDEGVYAYCFLNKTEQGQNAKELVQHGDICALSIFANQLKQNGGDVIHGSIKEVSLVLAGANPGAYIETVVAHSDDSDEEATIYNNSEGFEFYHAEEETKTERKAEEPKKEEKEEPKMEEKEASKEKTVQDVFDTLTEEQKNVVYALIGKALEDGGKEIDETIEIDEVKKVKHNAFENENKNENEVLSHSEFTEIINDAKRSGSLKDAFLAHSITSVSELFPEAQTVNKTPELVARDMDWVRKVMNAVHHTPFAKVKSTAANLTADDARAKGYVKGNQKVEEVLTAFKRITPPTTVYKLQKMDRDDVVDITDFDVVAWLKVEMRAMLEEELARAILIGDGRSSLSNDKINADCIRPILGDSNVYTVQKILTRGESEFAKDVIRSIVRARKDYKGSGNPTFFTTEDMLTDMLLLEDTNGRVIYDTIEKLTTALRVKEIVTVPVFDGVSRNSGDYDYNLIGIVVNLADYNVGADKGGAVTMFDDFDINFNKYEYLIETRCSGALVKPYSAISFEEKVAHTEG